MHTDEDFSLFGGNDIDIIIMGIVISAFDNMSGDNASAGNGLFVRQPSVGSEDYRHHQAHRHSRHHSIVYEASPKIVFPKSDTP